MAKILIVDDDPQVGRLLSKWVEQTGHLPTTALTLKAGLEEVAAQDFDVVFLDVMLPDGNGLKTLPRFQEAPSLPEVIIITGAGDPQGAELAIKSGAWDYMEKGSSLREMILALTRALQYREEKRAGKPPLALKRENIIGHSPQLQACFERLARAAGSEANVLITGETGTGKELFARAVYENSPRSGQPFVVVDCTAIPEPLVEGLLFGHEKGAFTGADQARAGLIKQADQGTLFLDEVGELPFSLQKAFLRVLQEHRFRPLGGQKEVESNFRLVAATNRDLEAMTHEGRFRQELLFRLRALTIDVPPLRERPGDLRDLLLYYVARFCERDGRETKGFTPDFLAALSGYDWPGNVRELIHTLEQAIIAAGDSPTLFPKHLPEAIRVAAARSAVTEGAPPAQAPAPGQDLPLLRELLQTETARLEEQYLIELMVRTKGEVKEACQISGLSRTALYNRLKKYGLSREVWRTR